jgi:hypothetical protein
MLLAFSLLPANIFVGLAGSFSQMRPCNAAAARVSALIATNGETYAARDAGMIAKAWQTSLPPKLVWNELARFAEPSGVCSWNQTGCITREVVRP